MTTREFQLHIDPSLYGFKFKDANYATIKYGTDKVGDNIEVIVFAIQLSPTLLCHITDREKLVRDAETAAKTNAEAYWSGQPAEFFTGIFKGFAPHI
jgi:hypothetical protein